MSVRSSRDEANKAKDNRTDDLFPCLGRLEGEPFGDYKIRRKADNEATKRFLRGYVVTRAGE
jgi:hypothetical protein